MRLTLNVAGEDAPVDLDQITARQIARLAGALGVDETDLMSLVFDPEAPVPVRVVVAVVACSLWQRGLPVDLDWLSDSITVGTPTVLTVHDADPDPDAPTADEIAAAAALLARA